MSAKGNLEHLCCFPWQKNDFLWGKMLKPMGENSIFYERKLTHFQLYKVGNDTRSNVLLKFN